jgi:hypothetical protein
MVFKPESDVYAVGLLTVKVPIWRFAKMLCLMFGLVWLVIASPLNQSPAQAGYWHTENLYGVELNRVEADGINVGIAMASDFYNTSYGGGPTSRCYKYVSDKIVCEAGSASIYCTSSVAGLTPCLRQAIHKCWDGLDNIHKKVPLVKQGLREETLHFPTLYRTPLKFIAVEWLSL